MPPEQQVPVSGMGGQTPDNRYDCVLIPTQPSVDPQIPSPYPKHLDFDYGQADDEVSPGLVARTQTRSGVPASQDTAGSVVFTVIGDSGSLLITAPRKESTTIAATTALRPARADRGYVHRETRRHEVTDIDAVREEQRRVVAGLFGGNAWKIVTGADGLDTARDSLRSKMAAKARRDPQGMSELVDQVMHGMVSDGGMWHNGSREAAAALLTDYILTEPNMEDGLIDRKALGESYCEVLSRLEGTPLKSAQLLHNLGVKIAADIPPTARNYLHIWREWQKVAGVRPEFGPTAITAQMDLDAYEQRMERRMIRAEMAGTQREVTNDQLGGKGVTSFFKYLSEQASHLLHTSDIAIRDTDPDMLLRLYNKAVANATSDPDALRALYEEGSLIVPFLPHTADAWQTMRNAWIRIEDSPVGVDLGVKAAELTSHLYLPEDQRQQVMQVLLEDQDLPYETIAQELGVTRTTLSRDLASLRSQGVEVKPRSYRPVDDLTTNTCKVLLKDGMSNRKTQILKEISAKLPQERDRLLANIIAGLGSEDELWTEQKNLRKEAGLALLSNYIDLSETDPELLAQSYMQALDQVDPESPQSVRVLHEAGKVIAALLPKDAQTWFGVRDAWKRIKNSVPEYRPFGQLESSVITSQIQDIPAREREIIIARLVNEDLQLGGLLIVEKVAVELGIPRESVGHYLDIENLVSEGRMSGGGQETVGTEYESDILRMLAEQGDEKLTATQIGNAFGIRRDTVYTIIKRMQRNGLVQKKGRGETGWVPTT